MFRIEEIITRDAKQYQVAGGHTICIAQVEVVGKGLHERKPELLEALRRERERQDFLIYALMITDVMSKGSELLFAGDGPVVARAFDAKPHDSVIELPGVMSRKKQVAPKLLEAMAH